MRKFTDQELTQEEVVALLKAALMAPSSKRSNCWQFIVVDDKDMLEKLSHCKEMGAAFLADAAMAVVVMADPLASDVWIDKQKTINLQLEMPVRLSTYRKGNAIPPLPGTNIFHSTELFHVFEMTRGYEPLLIVAYIGNRPVGKLLAVIRKSVRLFPPAIIKRCEIYGTGEYFDEEQNKEDLFGEILEHLTNEVLCKSFLIEFRNLENPLFGYKAFRRNNYFAINWLRVRNSLHSKTPYERLSMSRRRQINKALRNGAIMEIADNEKDIQDFSRMLKKAYSSQIEPPMILPLYFTRNTLANSFSGFCHANNRKKPMSGKCFLICEE